MTITWFHMKTVEHQTISFENLKKSTDFVGKHFKIKRDEIVFKMKLTSKEEMDIVIKRVEILEKKILKLEKKPIKVKKS